MVEFEKLIPAQQEIFFGYNLDCMAYWGLSVSIHYQIDSITAPKTSSQT